MTTPAQVSQSWTVKRWHLYHFGIHVRTVDGPDLLPELERDDWHSAGGVTGKTYGPADLEPHSIHEIGRGVIAWRERVILRNPPLIGWYTTPQGVRTTLRAWREAHHRITTA